MLDILRRRRHLKVVPTATPARYCKCGEEATVHRTFQPLGGSPYRVWTCKRHVNVACWFWTGYKWIPVAQFDPAIRDWEVPNRWDVY